nr:immunoglobulin heavy chain junction region [Macaca mulatta]
CASPAGFSGSWDHDPFDLW